MKTTPANNVDSYILHRHQTSGQSVQMFYDWQKLFIHYMQHEFNPMQCMKIEVSGPKEYHQQNVAIRKIATKQYNPYSIGNAILNDAFKQGGL